MEKKLHFGIIGLGYFGKHYLRLLQNHKDAKLIATADNAKDALKLLHSPEIECVIIATPAASHFNLASRALKAGKHVFLEKPMVIKLSEAYKLKKIVEKSKKVFLLGHQYLYNDYIKHLKRQLEVGVFGEIKYILAQNLYHGPIRRGIGSFWETAGHELSILDYLLGPLEVKNIVAGKAYVKTKKDEDFTTAIINLKKGPVITLVISWFMPKKVRSITIVGTKGMVIFDDVQKKDKLTSFFQTYPKNIKTSSHFFSPGDQKIFVSDVVGSEPLANELNHFIDCVKNSKTPLTDIFHGVRITKLLDLISRK